MKSYLRLILWAAKPAHTTTSGTPMRVAKLLPRLNKLHDALASGDSPPRTSMNGSACGCYHWGLSAPAGARRGGAPPRPAPRPRPHCAALPRAGPSRPGGPRPGRLPAACWGAPRGGARGAAAWRYAASPAASPAAPGRQQLTAHIMTYLKASSRNLTCSH